MFGLGCERSVGLARATTALVRALTKDSLCSKFPVLTSHEPISSVL